MERLTKRTALGIVGNNNKVKNYPLYKIAEYDELDYGIVGQCFNKLAEYEDAEEQGLLLKLPCKVGDTVYVLSFSRDKKRLVECVVKSIKICDEENHVVVYCKELGLETTLSFDRFGKTVFLTKEAAEQALAEMKGV